MKKIFLVLIYCGALVTLCNSVSLRAQQVHEVNMQTDEVESKPADFDYDIFSYEFDVTELDQEIKRAPGRASLFVQRYGIKLFLLALIAKQYCFCVLDYCLNNKFVNYLILDSSTSLETHVKNGVNSK